MRLPYFNFCDPSTLEEALSLMEDLQGGALPLAGGTDLIPVMKYGLQVPSTLVSLKKVNSLKGISQKGGDVLIGAMTPLVDLLASRIIKDNFAALLQAAEAVAAPPIWNVATVGGNICQNSRCLYYNQSRVWRLERPACLKAGGNVCHAVPKGNKCFSVYSGDLAPALIALGSMVTVEKRGRSRTISLQDLFSGNGLSPFALEKEELLTGVVIPLPDKWSNSSYVKMRVRPSVDYPLLSAAASITCGEDGKIEKIKLVLGAVGPNPVVVNDADRFFAGRMIDEVDFDALNEIVGKGVRMVDNLTLPRSYRRKMLPVLAGNAVRAAAESTVGKENT